MWKRESSAWEPVTEAEQKITWCIKSMIYEYFILIPEDLQSVSAKS